MRKALITAGLLVVFGTTAIAQSPANVEKAKRFRANQTASAIVTTTASQELNVEKQNILSNDNVLQSSTQLGELGARYAVAYSNNAAQLKELGAPYAIGLENGAQLQELGAPYAIGLENGAQLQELGAPYAIGLENGAQLQELGAPYAIGLENGAQLQELGVR